MSERPRPAEHPDMPWNLDSEGEATVLRVGMLDAGRTGSLVTHALRVLLIRGQGSRIGLRQVAMPGILPYPVAPNLVPIGA